MKGHLVHAVDQLIVPWCAGLPWSLDADVGQGAEQSGDLISNFRPGVLDQLCTSFLSSLYGNGL